MVAQHETNARVCSSAHPSADMHVLHCRNLMFSEFGHVVAILSVQ